MLSMFSWSLPVVQRANDLWHMPLKHTAAMQARTQHCAIALHEHEDG